MMLQYFDFLKYIIILDRIFLALFKKSLIKLIVDIPN